MYQIRITFIALKWFQICSHSEFKRYNFFYEFVIYFLTLFIKFLFPNFGDYYVRVLNGGHILQCTTFFAFYFLQVHILGHVLDADNCSFYIKIFKNRQDS